MQKFAHQIAIEMELIFVKVLHQRMEMVDFWL
jgi:hypothetical protein